MANTESPIDLKKYAWSEDEIKSIQKFMDYNQEKSDNDGTVNAFNTYKEYLELRQGLKKSKQEFTQQTRKTIETPLTVHLVPHSHDDVGWIKTVDEYYSGFRGSVSHARVSQILSLVVDELQKDPKRRFTYVEMKYFNMWYTRQP